MQIPSSKTGNALFQLIVVLLTVIIIYNSLPYFQQNSHHNILAAKENLSSTLWWKILFYSHIILAPLCMLCGPIQFSEYIRRHHTHLHKLSGRFYVYTTLFLAAPASLVMSFFATGGPIIATAFAFMSVLWFVATFKGFKNIIIKNTALHRQWMIRSFWYAAFALSFRAWFVVLKITGVNDMMFRANIAQWMGVFGNVIAAELIIRLSRKNN